MKIQISDSIPCGIVLALSGGCMDAYSYLFRGHVFANAQTGNMLLLGVNLANGDIPAALRYLWPVLAFTAGIILIIVAFIPESLDSTANIMISFACGIQVESFRKIHGNSIATTMCIGNLRSGTYNLDQYLNTREHSYLKKAALYYGVIISFVIGAIGESYFIAMIGRKAILLSPVLLILVLIIMFRRTDIDDGDTYIEE